MHGRMVNLYRVKEQKKEMTISEERFIEWNKATIFLEAVLTIDQCKSNLEKKENYSILLDAFPSTKAQFNSF